MPDLPAHITQLIEAQEYLDKECGDSHTPSAAKLRAILEAAHEVTQQRPTRFGNCGNCGSDLVNGGCKPDCPHRKLKEAMQS